MCDWHVHFLCSLPVFKCSVSCGMGIQVRKIDCVLPALANGSHTVYIYSQNVDSNNNNEKTDHIGSLSDAPSNGLNDESMQILWDEQISMECDPKLKPIATQSCTTGIECTTIINDNIGSNDHEEVDRITNASTENESENENGNDNTATDNDVKNMNTEADIVGNSEDVSVDQIAYETSVEGTNENFEENISSNTENASPEDNSGAESEELNEFEVFHRIFIRKFFFRFDRIISCIYLVFD